MFSLKQKEVAYLTQLIVAVWLMLPLTGLAATYNVLEATVTEAGIRSSIFIELYESESSNDLIWQVTDSSVLELSGSRAEIVNKVTSLEDNKYTEIIKTRNEEENSDLPLMIEGELMLNNKRYAHLILSPTFTTSSGQGMRCNSIKINMLTRQLENRDLQNRESIHSNNLDRDLTLLSTEVGTTAHAIITSSVLAESFQELAIYRSATGIESQVILIEDILNKYSGRDEAEQLREFCRQFYADGGMYILLGGDETILPIRYTTANFVTELPALDYLQLCDLYFADVDGEWDADNDGIWGERFGDLPDLEPDLMVGRLPFHTPEQVSNYVSKLIGYETSPGNANPDYLTNVFFFSSDQMRDYDTTGQHGYIAEAFPEQFQIDTTSGVEHSSGSTLFPSNQSAAELIPTLSEGYGIVNIIAHGRPDAFAVRTSGYNNWPKSYFTTEDASDIHGSFASLEQNNKVSFYYSLACDNAGFDQDQEPFVYRKENLATQLLALPDAGAIGFVGYSRWGWVGWSHLQQRAFFESLIAHPEWPAVASMYASHEAVPYSRDIIYGQLFLGDPALHVYTNIPTIPTISVTGTQDGIQVATLIDNAPLSDMMITVSTNSQVVVTGITGADGIIEFELDIVTSETYTVAANHYTTTTAMTQFTTSLATDIDDNTYSLPTNFGLQQNYPNPFNPTTTISFTLAQRSDVQLSVFNVAGQQINQIIDGNYAAGNYEVLWDGKDASDHKVASGVYFYRLQANTFSSTKKMLLLK